MRTVMIFGPLGSRYGLSQLRYSWSMIRAGGRLFFIWNIWK